MRRNALDACCHRTRVRPFTCGCDDTGRALRLLPCWLGIIGWQVVGMRGRWSTWFWGVGSAGRHHRGFDNLFCEPTKFWAHKAARESARLCRSPCCVVSHVITSCPHRIHANPQGACLPHTTGAQREDAHSHACPGAHHQHAQCMHSRHTQ